MADQVTRSAGKLAALIAVPVAVLAGIGAFLVLNNAFQAAVEPPATPPGQATPAPGAAPTEPVEMPAPELSERAETVCRALLSQLPATVDELVQRPVTEGAEQNAAYGDPPVTVACGGPPAEYAPTDTVHPFEGVCWHAEERPEATVWTTLDREVPVRVRVPAAYDGPFQQVAPFTAPIVETVPSGGDPPSGC